MPVAKNGNKVLLQVGSHTYWYDESRPILGRGAMGTVYLGHEIGTRKLFAIKRVKDVLSNRLAIRERARLEASLMFNHPNLVEMYGCCEVAPNSGPIFIISGFIQGENIDSFISQNVKKLPNSEQRICNMFISVLDALSYIHSKKILHLDIKPSNIMVEQGRNVRLMDLGIADVSAHTEVHSEMMGTPRYAAPEQFAGSTVGTELTNATDIYQAGVTLYELLTGKNPFVSNDVKEAKRLHETVTLKKMAGISDPVLSVVKKATAIKPKERYQSATEMKTALRSAINGAPTDSMSSRIFILSIIGIAFIAVIVVLLLIIQ